LKITVDTPDAQNYIIYDFLGNQIGLIQEYDTQTQEAVILIPAVSPDKKSTIVFFQALDKTDPEILAVKIRIPGSYVMNKVTGERVK
jgi:hypothetical protein